ncbi:DUF3575 domain-containing protein [Sphingobacterium sp. xlx-130]|uniref:DUF3575 domain-containing protein n=1 Tax=Sphingobacterium sp. xlx-130 TaxID=2654323 RepID=UPI0013DC885D|nr:DUF3575 domain-containing protein [Sphingobacterium sp. xlx-130]
MNKNLLILATLVLAMLPFTSWSQTEPTAEPSGNNMVKFNVLPLLGGKFAFEYERSITDRISAGAAISFRPEKKLPFQSTVQDFVDDEDLNKLISDFKSSNFSITPEVRFYLSKRGLFRGFYMAPYVKYANYKASVPFDFDVAVEESGTEIFSRTETIPLEGTINSFTGGFSLGFNFKLSRQLHLDWRLIGPGYGSANGKASGTMVLNPDEQQALRESMEDLKTDLGDLPLGGIKMEYDIHENGTDIHIKRSPWAGIRTGLSIGYRF